MQSLRTLHVETGMHSLGGPAQVVYLMSGLKARGHETLLVCPDGSSVARHAASEGMGVATVPLHTDLDISFIWRMCRIIKRMKPDLLHLHSRRGADLMGGIAGRLARVPAIILSRRIDNPVKRGPVSDLKYGALCDRIISISDAVTNALLEGGVDAGKIARVRSAVDAARYDVVADGKLRDELGIPRDAPLVGIVAQLIERKGHRYLLDAMPGILEKYPNTRLLILGEGHLLSALKNQTRELGIEEKVIFAGFRNDMPHMLAELDMLIHPATMEGLGVAILQAMAARIPVVAAAVGGLPESVQDGVSGFLIPPCDVEAIGRSVIRLLGDTELRRSMGAAGRKIVEEQFSVDGMVEGVLSVYCEVLGIEGVSLTAAGNAG